MTSKEFVLSKFPKARSERQKSGMIKGMQRTYYLIRNGRETMYMASGDTESKAWKKAKEIIIESEMSINANKINPTK